jgi:hypothetical protein
VPRPRLGRSAIAPAATTDPLPRPAFVMPGGLGPRFALEAGFLIVLAAVAAYARLDATEIIVVMAGGWLLASVFEVLAARRERLYPGASWEPRVEATETASPTEAASEAREQEEAVPEAAPSSLPAAKVDDEATGEIERPKRKWFRRAPVPVPVEEEIAARPSARHVRLIRESAPTDDVEPRKDAEAGS